MTVIRYVISALFLWFGLQQVLSPSQWTGFLPDVAGALPIPETDLVRLNGIFEVISAGMLAVGAYARLFAHLLAVHLAAIAVVVGGPIGARDGALAAVTFALAMAEPDALTLDARKRARVPDAINTKIPT